MTEKKAAIPRSCPALIENHPSMPWCKADQIENSPTIHEDHASKMRCKMNKQRNKQTAGSNSQTTSAKRRAGYDKRVAVKGKRRADFHKRVAVDIINRARSTSWKLQTYVTGRCGERKARVVCEVADGTRRAQRASRIRKSKASREMRRARSASSMRSRGRNTASARREQYAKISRTLRAPSSTTTWIRNPKLKTENLELPLSTISTLSTFQLVTPRQLTHTSTPQ